MEVITILVLLVLNITLPTLDTFTDFNLVYKLYRGAQGCKYRSENHTEYFDSITILISISISIILLHNI